MESSQMPHDRLTDEEVKKIVSDMAVDLREFKELFLEQMSYHERNVRLLKKHFCPEKFSIIKMSVEELEEVYKKANYDCKKFLNAQDEEFLALENVHRIRNGLKEAE